VKYGGYIIGTAILIAVIYQIICLLLFHGLCALIVWGFGLRELFIHFIHEPLAIVHAGINELG